MTGPAAGTTSSTGLAPNLAAALSYLLGLVTGIILFVLEKDNQFVRFHAMQSILLSVALIAINIALSIVAIFPVIGWVVALVAYPVIGIIAFILWIMLMLKAFQGQEWELPIIGRYARQYSTGAAAI